MAEPILRYQYKSIAEGKDMKPFGEGTATLGVTYGDWTSNSFDYNGSKKANCKVTISYSNVRSVVHADNSVTVTGRITKAELKRTGTGVPTKCHQDVWVWFGDPETQVSHIHIGSGQSGTWNLLPNQYKNFSFTIPASNNPTEKEYAAIHFKNRCSEKPASLDPAYPPDEFKVGLFITNPNPPTYIPGKILDNGGTWQSHNRSAGTAKILQPDSTWRVMTTDSGGQAYDNPPQIKDDSGFVNMRKIGENA